MKITLTLLFMSMISVNAFALAVGGSRGGIERRSNKKSEPEIVKWEGYVNADGGHTTRHDHDLDFVRKSDGESFDIVDSPALEKVHCNTSKKLLVKIEAEKTPRVLFWGDNLIVKNFEVLEELDQVPHKIYKRRTASSSRADRP